MTWVATSGFPANGAAHPSRTSTCTSCPARAAARYVIAPLFALFIGIAADRPQLELRTILGLILMAAGAGYLLLAAEPPSLDTPPASFLPR